MLEEDFTRRRLHPISACHSIISTVSSEEYTNQRSVKTERRSRGISRRRWWNTLQSNWHCRKTAFDGTKEILCGRESSMPHRHARSFHPILVKQQLDWPDPLHFNQPKLQNMLCCRSRLSGCTMEAVQLVKASKMAQSTMEGQFADGTNAGAMALDIHPWRITLAHVGNGIGCYIRPLRLSTGVFASILQPIRVGNTRNIGQALTMVFAERLGRLG
ncbi:hypothetical protein CPC08DRAFT_753435 [Agrocybe pediades]|nr:hypothetical protein CPC08DRAFT_753435 [Agrocybe pediades]